MRRFYVFLSLFMLTVMLQSMRAETINEGFETVTLVDANGDAVSGWSFGAGLSNGWKIIDGQISQYAGSTNYGLWTTARTGSKSLEASYSATNNAYIVIPTQLMGEFKFWARRTSSRNAGTVKIYEVEEQNGKYSIASTISTFSPASTTWTEYTTDLGTNGKLIAINLSRAAIDDIEAQTYEAVSGPVLTVTQNGNNVKTGTKHDFGFVSDEATVEYTLSNTGTGNLVLTINTTEGYSVSENTVTISEGEEKVLTITQTAETYGIRTGTVTIQPEEGNTFVINISGLVRNPEKIYADFSTTPDNWTIGEGWIIADGYVAIGWDYTNIKLSTPIVQISEDETIYLKYRANGGSSFSRKLYLWYSEDNVAWTQIGANYAQDASESDWKTIIVTDIPVTAKYIAISGCYIAVDDFYGCTPFNGAVMMFEPKDYDFGMIKTTAEQSFTIKNVGKANLTNVSALASNTAFSVEVASSIEAESETNMKVTLGDDVNKLQTAQITLKADDMDDKTFNVTGYIIDNTALYFDFDDNKTPDNWENNGWTFVDGKARAPYGAYKSIALVSPKLIVKEGDELALRVKQDYDSGWLKVYISSDNGENWIMKKEFTNSDITTELFKTIIVDNIEAGECMLKLEGNYVYIDQMNGFNLNDNAPVMAVSMENKTIANEFTDDFGRTKEALTHTYTVANTGTGILQVEISTSNEEQFTVSETILELGKGESKTFDIALVFNNEYGTKEAEIIIHPVNEGLNDVKILATAITRDPEMWEEDFENGIPETWINTGWVIADKPTNGNGTKMAFATMTEGYELTTPRLKAVKGEKLEFETLRRWNDEKLTVEYSIDERKTWTVIYSEAPAENQTLETLSITAPEDGYYYLRFSGRYNYIDNIAGFKLSPKEHDVEIASQDIPLTAHQYAPYSAEVTVKELIGVEESVYAELYVDNEVAATTDTITLQANETQKLILSYTPQETKDDATIYIKVYFADETLQTESNSIKINAALVISDTEENVFEEKEYPSVVLKYHGNKGLNTLALPFALNNLEVFGTGAKAYEFSSATREVLNFTIAEKFYAGYPYLLYLEEDTNVEVILNNVNLSALTPKQDMRSGTIFQAVYNTTSAADMEEGCAIITEKAHIKAATEETTVKGLGGYLVLNTEYDTDKYCLNIEGHGVVTSINAIDIKAEGTLYDLSGRKINEINAPRGIYIKDGRKVVII